MENLTPASHGKKILLLTIIIPTVVLWLYYVEEDDIERRYHSPVYSDYLDKNDSLISLQPTEDITNGSLPISKTRSTTTLIQSAPQNRSSSSPNSIEYTQTTLNTDTKNHTDYLIWSSKCRIPNLDPFSHEVKKFFHPEKYKPCKKRDLLTYTAKSNNTVTLFVNQTVVPSYGVKEVYCCYSNISRKWSKLDPDNGYQSSKCQDFVNSIDNVGEFILVKCGKSKGKKDLYSNTHATVRETKKTIEKTKSVQNDTKPISVLFVGIDSISRLNFIRMLPKTYHILKDNNWVEFLGYNKVADNTFPNLMALFTGMNETLAYKVCRPREVGYLDTCKFIWKNFSDHNYVTGYAEDESSINTFNYNKKGFSKPPTDFYFRPYVMASEKLKTVKKDGMTYCAGPETSGERILNAAKDFAVTFKNQPNFGFFWMNTFSHNELNSPSGLDGKVRDFLRQITEEGVLENSIVFFLSDHGLRFGEIRYTRSGWLEERLPYMFVSIPKSFQIRFPVEYSNLKLNAEKRLTNPYDLYMTLQDILLLSGKNLTIDQAVSCPLCQSLFREVDVNRSCEDAAIEQHWCTCTGYKNINAREGPVKKIAQFIVDNVMEKIHSRSEGGHCAKLKLKRIISSSISDSALSWYKNETYYLLVVETSPSAVFEATVGVVPNSGELVLLGGISRLDYYADHSKCVSDSYLKMYCYCHR